MTMIARCLTILGGVIFWGNASMASSPNQGMEETLDVNEETSLTGSPAFSPSETPEDVRALLEESKAVRERAKRSREERDFLYGDDIDGHPGEPTLRAIRQVCNVFYTNPTETFFEKTSRVRRGFVVLAAVLQDKAFPEYLPQGHGYQESEWPPKAQGLWIHISALAENYGQNKNQIESLEQQLRAFHSVSHPVRYIPFQFNQDPNVDNKTLEPIAQGYEAQMGIFEGSKKLHEDQKPLFQQKFGEAGANFLGALASNLQVQSNWAFRLALLTAGLDAVQKTASTLSSNNVIRHCLVTAILDCGESLKLTHSQFQEKHKELSTLQDDPVQ